MYDNDKYSQPFFTQTDSKCEHEDRFYNPNTKKLFDKQDSQTVDSADTHKLFDLPPRKQTTAKISEVRKKTQVTHAADTLGLPDTCDFDHPPSRKHPDPKIVTV